jgi:hypothetical protein
MLRVESLKIDKFKALFENIVRYIEERKHLFQNSRKPDIWEMLVSEGQYELIEKLRRVERREGGFGTIVIPPDGFSKSKSTHNLVVNWLSENGVNILDVNREKSELERSLKEPHA